MEQHEYHAATKSFRAAIREMRRASEGGSGEEGSTDSQQRIGVGLRQCIKPKDPSSITTIAVNDIFVHDDDDHTWMRRVHQFGPTATMNHCIRIHLVSSSSHEDRDLELDLANMLYNHSVASMCFARTLQSVSKQKRARYLATKLLSAARATIWCKIRECQDDIEIHENLVLFASVLLGTLAQCLLELGETEKYRYTQRQLGDLGDAIDALSEGFAAFDLIQGSAVRRVAAAA